MMTAARRRWPCSLLILFTLLCALVVLLPGLPGLRLALPAAVRFPLAVIAVLLLPGYLLDEWLHISGARVSLFSPPLWFALSCGLLAPAGWLIAGRHLSLRPLHFIVSGLLLALLVALLLKRGAPRAGVWEFRRRDWQIGLFVLVLLALFVGLIVFWAPTGTADYWIYRAYLREYADSPAINIWDPFLGESAPVTPRMRYEVWLVNLAFVGQTGCVEPAFHAPELLDPLCAILALLATFGLSQELLGSARRAMAAVGLQIMAYLYSPAIHQPGHYLLIRTSEDKTIAFFIILPVVWALILLDRPDVALRILTNETAPSIWSMLRHPMTPEPLTIMPEFYTGGMIPHPGLSTVGFWAYQSLGGLRPDPEAPGFRRLVIQPQIARTLDWARAEYDSIRGSVGSHWELEGDRLALTVTIPANVSAVVHVVFVALMSIGYIRDRWIDPAGAVARKAAAEAAKQELMKAMAPPAPKPVEKAPEAQSEPAEAPKPAAGDEAIPAGSAGGAEAKRITEAAPAAEIPTQPGDASALLDDTR